MTEKSAATVPRLAGTEAEVVESNREHEGPKGDAVTVAPEVGVAESVESAEPDAVETEAEVVPQDMEPSDEAEIEAYPETAPMEEDRSAGADLQALSTEVAGLKSAVHAFVSRSSEQDLLVRRMQSMIEELQQDQIRQLLKPVFEKLASIHADAKKNQEQHAAEEPVVAEDFKFFAQSIEDLMGMYDLESVQAAVGEPLDPKLHQAARAATTDQRDLAGRIKRVQRQGFKFAGANRVFLPARVVAYRYEAPAPRSESTPQPNPSS